MVIFVMLMLILIANSHVVEPKKDNGRVHRDNNSYYMIMRGDEDTEDERYVAVDKCVFEEYLKYIFQRNSDFKLIQY